MGGQTAVSGLVLWWVHGGRLELERQWLQNKVVGGKRLFLPSILSFRCHPLLPPHFFHG